jgi:hypothetical protein
MLKKNASCNERHSFFLLKTIKRRTLYALFRPLVPLIRILRPLLLCERPNEGVFLHTLRVCQANDTNRSAQESSVLSRSAHKRNLVKAHISTACTEVQAA